MNVTDVLQVLNHFIEWLKQVDRASPFWIHDRLPSQFRAAIAVVEQPPQYRTMTAEQGHELARVALTLFDLFTQWKETSPIPLCPVCQQTMLFLGQHDLNQVDIFGFEGYLYAFVCLTCQKATMVQQH